MISSWAWRAMSTNTALYPVMRTIDEFEWHMRNVPGVQSVIALAGIVVNNAILLVDQAGRLIGDGINIRDALTEAGRRRLRPILMTTLTTILGLLPLALGIGEGSDAQAPLARAVVGGLTGSTLITLVLIPVVYSLFHPDPKARHK